MNIKHEKLGMPIGTATNRLVKDLLFEFAIGAGHKCYRCGQELIRKNFSIDHKKDWLHSDSPVELFFDLSNIAFSHRTCNSGARVKPKCVHGVITCKTCALATKTRYRETHRYMDSRKFRKERGWK